METLAFQFLFMTSRWRHTHDIKSINIHYNISQFSVFTVPPDLLECKDCPVKIEVLEVNEQHKNIAAKALKKFNSQSNHTNYFNVDKVEKALKLVSGILS